MKGTWHLGDLHPLSTPCKQVVGWDVPAASSRQEVPESCPVTAEKKQAKKQGNEGFPLLPSPPSWCLWSPAPWKSHRASASCKGGKGGAELGVHGSGEGVPRESGSRLHCEASFTVSRHQLPSCHGNSQLGLPGGSGEVSRDMGVVEDEGGERRGGMFLANVRC